MSGLLNARELVEKPQTLKKTISKYLNVKVKWRDKQFKVIVDNKTIKNYIVPKIVKQLGLPHKVKKNLYILVIILGKPVLYKVGIINLETGLV
jgi:hypothetical protein